MKNQPALFLYCQHSLGMGHLRRSMEIAKALADDFRVLFINGGRIPDAIPRPDAMEFIDLPPLSMNTEGNLISHRTNLDLTAAKELRRDMILEQLQVLQPDVLLVELFPFGRKKFAFELLPLLRQARRSRPKPLVVCDLRDILVDDRHNQQHHDDRACWLSNRYFDAILMHSDPQFARLEESFRPEKTLTTPLIYTGFVCAEPASGAPAVKHPGIVVSAGGGNVGATLFNAAIEAQGDIWRQYSVPMTIVAGPFLPEGKWRALQEKGRNRPGLTLQRVVPDLQCVLRQAAATISQCGYNTAMDLLQCRVPALLVPYAEGRENEQSKRALKLQKLGLARVLPETDLSAAALVREIGPLLSFKPKAIDLQLDGAGQSRTILLRLLDESRHGDRERQHVGLA